MNQPSIHFCQAWLLGCGALLAATPALAQPGDPLAELINAYRAAPHHCEGRRLAPAAPLVPHPALASLPVTAGTMLESALERAGYPVAQAEAIQLSGAQDARSVMEVIERQYCKTLSSPRFSAIGISRTDDSWLIVFAQPAPAPPVSRLPPAREAGHMILKAVNRARAKARMCGTRHFPAAPALAWHAALGDAALGHSTDMANQRYFDHQGRDGRQVGARAVQSGYRWRGIGENIALGQHSPDEVVDDWLSSPGHCANIMSARFTEMGAAYAVADSGDGARIYWTQVLGTPR